MSTTTMKKICSIFIGSVMDPCVGQWGDLPMDPDELDALCDDIRGYAHCEELFIPDSEGVMQVGEYDNIQKVNDRAQLIEDLDTSDRDILEAIIENYTNDFDEALEIVTNQDYMVYYNCTDMTDVAYEVVEECGYLANVPENVARYFDYEAFGRDLDIEGTFIYAGGGVMIEIIR